MDNDTKKIFLLIARALQLSALAQLAHINVPYSLPMQDAMAKDVNRATDLWRKLEEAEKNNA